VLAADPLAARAVPEQGDTGSTVRAEHPLGRGMSGDVSDKIAAPNGGSARILPELLDH
jgi:hypothetical protein